MKTPQLAAAWSLLLACLCAIAPAQAAGAIHRCETPDGMTVYTDGACRALDARPAPMSTDLVTRLAMDGESFGMDSLRDAARSNAIRTRRAPQEGCARSPRQLSLDLIGAFAQLFGLVTFAILLYAVVVLFQLVTLPVEFDASRRAMGQLNELGLVAAGEAQGARKVLTAAAMTYVAAALAALSQLAYYALVFLGNRN